MDYGTTDKNILLIKKRSNTKKITIGILDFTPYPDGHGRHLIGQNTDTMRVECYRFKRIKKIEILKFKYSNQKREDLLKQFNDSWKIWLSKTPPKEVILQFNKCITPRVLETKWHNNQRTELQPDNSLIWKCKIAEPKEMEYWILGWGSNVKVLAPPQLKQRIKEEIKKLYKSYELVAVNATGKDYNKENKE